jgi:hypothetical protein
MRDLLIGLLVAGAYLVPSVAFALAVKPAAEAVERVGRATAL